MRSRQRRSATENPRAIPDASSGMGVWDMFLYFLVFPLSRPGFRAFHGWAMRLRQRRGAAAFVAVLPACATIVVMQVRPPPPPHPPPPRARPASARFTAAYVAHV